MKEKIEKKGFKKRLFSVGLALAMVFSLVPIVPIEVKAATLENVTYVDDNNTSHIASSCEVLEDRGSGGRIWLSSGKWYIAPSNLTINSEVYLQDGANLILADNSTLTIPRDIELQGSVNIWCQSTGDSVGKLSVNHTYSAGSAIYAGSNASSKIVNVNGGEITISSQSIGVGDNITFNVNGGTLTVAGVSKAMSSAPTLGSGIEVLTASANVDGSSPVETYASSDIATYKYLKIGKSAPQHTWGYTSVGATLTATCNKGCGASTAHTATLTLTASSANYSDIDNLSAFNTATGQNISETGVKFYRVSTKGATTGGTEVDKSALTETGYYYAALEVGGKKAVKAFTVGTPTQDAGGNSGNEKAPENFSHDTKQEKDNLAGSKLNTKVDDLFSRVLTPQEQDEVKKEGVTTNVWLEVKPEDAKNISASDAEKIKNVTPAGYTIPSNGYLDINLWKKIGDSAATTVPNLSGKVSITVKVPTDLQKSGRTYKIIRLHGGKAEALATTQDSNFNLTFETDGFSTYAIAYSDNPATAPASGGTSPKTGETGNMPLVILILAMSVVGLGFTSRKKISK